MNRDRDFVEIFGAVGNIFYDSFCLELPLCAYNSMPKAPTCFVVIGVLAPGEIIGMCLITGGSLIFSSSKSRRSN